MTAEEVWDQIKDEPGWCWREKSDFLYNLAAKAEPYRNIVEIGVFGGRSLLPLVAGAEFNGGILRGSLVRGYDIYERHPAENKEGAQEWWDKIDYEKLHHGALTLMDRCGFKFSVIEKLSSVDASLLHGRDTLAILHIDGSHRTWDAMEDVMIWNRKLCVGGHLILDDTNWPELKPVVAMVNEGPFSLVATVAEEGKGEMKVWVKG